MSDIEDLLPSKPIAPLPSDCCGSGCSPCVHDIYEEDICKWKKKCKVQSLNNASSSEQIISSNAYTSFEIMDIKQISPDTFVYKFKLPAHRKLDIAIGQHIIVKGLFNNKFITRPYSPISDVNAEGNFELLIKIYSNGKMSSVVKEWKIADQIPMRGPYGSFTYKSNSFKRIIMLTAGSGIAPIYQIIRTILNDEDDMTKILLLYSSKCFKDILLRKELYELEAFWNFTLKHYLSQEANLSEKLYRENVELHRITKDSVEVFIQEETPENTLILICGTKSFEKDMINAALNVLPTSDHIFRF